MLIRNWRRVNLNSWPAGRPLPQGFDSGIRPTWDFGPPAKSTHRIADTITGRIVAPAGSSPKCRKIAPGLQLKGFAG